MFLKYLEIQGFKSFPDKVKIEFNKGITGIVGPNGSGKSNVSDAIRWVMGEQSIKSLRGGKMEDVIFSGTEARKPLSFAEVSICFDNTHRLFNVEFNEVLITRRYFRSGESEYYINKAGCRLKDVHELLMDTGMGKDGYSVVGQGKIDEMITAKPEERRAIFEEASGISKYKYRKIESERKIQHTEENLVRLLDLLSEIEVRLEPLKNESAKAKKYLELKAELKEHEINLSVNMLEKIKVSLEKFKSDYDTICAQINGIQQKITQTEESHVKYNEELQLKETEREELNTKLLEINKLISNYENQINIFVNNLKNNNENAARIVEEIEETEKAVKETGKDKELHLEKLSELERVISELNGKLSSLKEEYEAVDKEVEASNGKVDECNNKIVELYRGLSDKNAELVAAKKEFEGILLRKKNINDDIEIAKEDIDTIKERIVAEENKLNENSSLLEKIKKEQDEKASLKNASDEKISALEEKINKLAVAIDQAESKKKMLEDMEKEMEGYSYAVKTVVNENAKGSLKNIRLYGTVSKNIDVDSKYAVAIDAVLGNVLQNIITETEEDAKTAINYLKKVKGGRATFLPIASVKGRVLETKEFRGEPGYIALASEVIECGEKFRGIVNEILGRTLLIDNIDNAIKFARKFSYKHKIVTLEGEVINAGGAITGGNLGKGSSFLSRTAQIKQLASSVEENAIQLEASKKELVSENANKNELSQQCERLYEKLQLLENEIFKIRYNVEHYKSSLEKADEEYKSLVLERDSLDKKAESNAQAEKIFNEEKTGISEEIEKLREEIKNIQNQSSEKLSASKEINNKIMKLNAEISENESEKYLILHKVEEMDLKVERLLADIEKKKKEIGFSDDEENNINAQIEKMRGEIESLKGKYTQTEECIEKNKTERTEIQESINKLNADNKEYNETLIILSKEQAKTEGKISSRESQFESINNKLWEEYELTYITALEYKKDVENLAELKKYVDKVRGSIRNLGNVNVNAIEEYTQTKERYDFLTGQKEDLTKAKEALNNVIHDMETLMVKQFRSQLEIINKTFTKTFKELFGGGSAELVLTDENDLLNSGVEIIAQPPGKKLQNMTLFSGGEKAIIAISLLFSLLEVRPSPLCVLDEIEAALDDVNVNRFAAYLRKISLRSQIAIITHRRGTMEEADVLYGVTMQEKGVSKLLSLNISEVEEKILKNKGNE